MKLVRVTVLSLAVLCAACGGSDEREAVAETGRLVLEKTHPDGPVFIEGSVTHVKIVRDDGETIVDEERPPESVGAPLFDEALRPGTYTLVSVERPCDANCGYLDRPVESTRCTLDVRVEAGRTATVQIAVERARQRAVVSCAAS